MDLTKPLTDLEGNAFADGATYKTVLLGALLNVLRGDETLTGEQKFKLYALSMKINDTAADCKIAAEDVVLLKDRVGRAYPPLVVGRVFALLDPAAA